MIVNSAQIVNEKFYIWQHYFQLIYNCMKIAIEFDYILLYN